MSRRERKAMIQRARPELSLSRQCEILAISRSSFYYAPKGKNLENLALMRRIDALFLKYLFFGSRQMVRRLRRDGKLTRFTVTMELLQIYKDELFFFLSGLQTCSERAIPTLLK